MQITQITKLSEKRSRVWIEQESAFVLYPGELRRYGIKEGEELEEAAYREIMEEVLPKRAKLRVMNLLKSREYTTEQLRNKLRQGYYPESIIEQALEYVASFHYTDDLRYALDYITSQENRRSQRRINQDLLTKGITQDILEQAWQKWQADGGVLDEQGMIQKWLEKKKYSPQQADYKEKQKMYAFLMRKGFSGEQIRRALGEAGV